MDTKQKTSCNDAAVKGLLLEVATTLQRWSGDKTTSGYQHEPMLYLSEKIYKHLKECGTGCGYKELSASTHCDKMMKDPAFVRESLRSDLIMEITEAICEVLNSYGLRQDQGEE
jgi:hypothetical protein